MDTIQARWVVGTYYGNQAKLVLAHSAVGIGYVLIKTGKDGGQVYCVAALRYTESGPLPDHMNEVKDTEKIRNFEETFRARHGFYRRQPASGIERRQELLV